MSVNRTLDQVSEPSLRYVLDSELLEERIIPRERRPDFVFCFETVLFVQSPLPLQIRGEIIVVGKYEAFFKVGLDFAFDLIDPVL